MLTFGKDIVDGRIQIEVYTKQAESADKFLSKIQNAIETYKGTLASNRIRRIRVTDTNSDRVERGGISVHIRRITFSFRYIYDNTHSY